MKWLSEKVLHLATVGCLFAELMPVHALKYGVYTSPTPTLCLTYTQPYKFKEVFYDRLVYSV